VPAGREGVVKPRERIYLLVVFVTAVFLAWNALDLALRAGPDGARAFHPTTGRSRDVDVDRIRGLIEGGSLSDHEALFAHPADR
jgi:hypothetical protein